MRESKKKIGLFSNAKYSRPVFRNVPTSVIERANKDIEALIRPSARHAQSQKGIGQEMDRKTLGMKRSHHKAFPENLNVQQTPEVSNCYVDADPLGDLQWGNRVPSRNTEERVKERQQFLSSRIEDRVRPMAAPSPPERSMDSDFGFEELSPEKSTQVSAENRRYFPSEAPLEKIVHNMLLSFPQLTLKNNEPMEYADAAFTLARNALVTQIYQSSLKDATTHNLSAIPPPEAQINETAFATMQDKTMNFHVDYQPESDDWSQDGNVDDESPTSYHWSFEDVPDPEIFPQSLEKLGRRAEEQVEQYSECNKDDSLFDFRKQVDSTEYAWDLDQLEDFSTFRTDLISPGCERLGRNQSQSQYETSFFSGNKYF